MLCKKMENAFSNSDNQGVLPTLHLLSRHPDAAYLLEWTDLLAQHKQMEEVQGTSVIVFRLANEWLAMPTAVFQQVITMRTIHRIPHHTGEILLGVVNFEGQITLCINMHHFLSIDHDPFVPVSKTFDVSRKRMLAIHKEQEFWIFPVDEIYGVVHCDEARLENVPVTLSKSMRNYLKGIIHWNAKSVGYLDEELLFYALKRSLL